MEVYFCDPGYCSWAFGQQPKVDSLKDVKYFLGRARDIGYYDKKEQENEGHCVTAKLRKEIQDRRTSAPKSLAKKKFGWPRKWKRGKRVSDA